MRKPVSGMQSELGQHHTLHRANIQTQVDLTADTKLLHPSLLLYVKASLLPPSLANTFSGGESGMVLFLSFGFRGLSTTSFTRCSKLNMLSGDDQGENAVRLHQASTPTAEQDLAWSLKGTKHTTAISLQPPSSHPTFTTESLKGALHALRN